MAAPHRYRRLGRCLLVLTGFNTLLLALIFLVVGCPLLFSLTRELRFCAGEALAADEDRAERTSKVRLMHDSLATVTALRKRADASGDGGVLPVQKGVIAFIHGLSAQTQTAWRNPKTREFWPSLLQNDPELSQYDIYLVSYPTGNFAPEEALGEVIGNLQFHLDEKWSDEFHVVLVAHSLGGLIAREAIVRSKAETRPWQTLTLITLASPFLGSDLADFLEKTRVQGTHMNFLSTREALARALSKFDWAECRRRTGGRLFHCAGFETLPTHGVIVVSKESATALADVGEPYRDNHLTIAKPENASAKVHRDVKDWIHRRETGEVITVKQRQEREDHLVLPQLPPAATQDPSNQRNFHLGPGAIPVRKSILVPYGVTLNIAPGSTLSFQDGAILHSQGKILAGLSGDGQAGGEPVVFDFSPGAEGPAEGGVFLQGEGTAGSKFAGCAFRKGRGLRLEKPSSNAHFEMTFDQFRRAIHRVTPGQGGEKDPASLLGGALALGGASEVEFSNCTFDSNRAYRGGAVFSWASDRIRLTGCVFSGNVSGFGGGAVFLEVSECYLRHCRFENNHTGDPALPAEERSPWACGGAIYSGNSYFRCTGDRSAFTANSAEYAGGAIYAITLNKGQGSFLLESVLADATFAGNRSQHDECGGGAIYVDNGSHLNLTGNTFAENRAGDGTIPGQAVFDNTEGIVWHGRNQFLKNGSAWDGRNARALASRSQAREALKQHFQLFDWPLPEPLLKSSKERAPGDISALIIHQVSDPAAGGLAPALDTAAGDAWEQRLKRVREQFEATGLAPHYLIDPAGIVFQLVPDLRVASHASQESRMPDGRGNLDDFSIGIALIGVRKGGTSGVQAYEDAQYRALEALLDGLQRKYPATSGNLLDGLAAGGVSGGAVGELDWARIRRAFGD